MSGFRFAEGLHKSHLSGARVTVQGSGLTAAISQPVLGGWTAACSPALWPGRAAGGLALSLFCPQPLLFGDRWKEHYVPDPRLTSESSTGTRASSRDLCPLTHSRHTNSPEVAQGRTHPKGAACAIHETMRVVRGDMCGCSWYFYVLVCKVPHTAPGHTTISEWENELLGLLSILQVEKLRCH